MNWRGRSRSLRRRWRWRARRARLRRARRRSCDSLCRRNTTGPRHWRASWRRHGVTSKRSWRCRARRARARRDVETQLALSSKAGDEAAQVKKAAESATAELRQSLQKEHDRAEALTGELARARRDLEAQLALSSKAGDEAAQLKQLKA